MKPDFTRNTPTNIPTGRVPPQALYQAIYRLAVLADMYTSNGDDHKADDARNHAREMAANLKQHFADSDYDYARRCAGVQIG